MSPKGKDGRVVTTRPVIAEFTTFRGGRVRTVGVGCVQDESPDCPGNFSDAITLAAEHQEHVMRPDATAKGKVFFLRDNSRHVARPRMVCFQVRDAEAAEVFCGNSIAAAAALYAVTHRRLNVGFRINVAANGSSFEADVEVTPEKDQWLVRQVWRLGDIHRPVEGNILGHDVARASILNEYLRVKGPLTVPVAELAATWGGMDSVGGKIAVIDAGESVPQVEFHNCNGKHGAAPLTGLVTIATAASMISWLRPLALRSQISTPAGTDYLPVVHWTAGAGPPVLPPFSGRQTGRG